MKKRYFIFILFTNFCHAQTPKKFVINPGQRVYDVITLSNIYAYPNFELGNVQFKNNALGTAKMNYNTLLGQIEFIDEKGDTLTLNNAETINYIQLAEDTFYIEKGYIKMLKKFGDIALGVKKQISITNVQKVGGFGEPQNGSIDNYSSFNSNENNFKQLVVKETTTFSEYFYCYLGDKFNKFIPATKKNIFKFFAKQEAKLNAYLHANEVDIKKSDDLIKLMEYMTK